MREILFRGKSISDNKWYTGMMLSIDIESDGNIDDPRQHTCCIVPENVEFYRGELGGFDFVNPETVGQYVGLHDRNGKKIFEGDIVKCSIIYDIGCYPHSETKIVEVKYIEGCFWPFYNCERNIYEVIGNIHDNPELLEDK